MVGNVVVVVNGDGPIEDSIVIGLFIVVARGGHAVGGLETHAPNQKLRVSRVCFIMKALGVDAKNPVKDPRLLVTVVPFAEPGSDLELEGFR